MPLYAATLFLSAGLIFCVEPMFSKMVLPLLGGTASVWSIAMVVFQGLLLAGYVYAHILTRWLGIRTSAIIHVGVLALGALSLPIAISHAFDAPPAHGIALWTIGLFFASVGLPCFALSANAPLLQSWLAESGGGANPYGLYRASNLGSFAVLLAYPFAIEPFAGLSLQSRVWSDVYLLLVLCIAACGALAALGQGNTTPAPLAVPSGTEDWRDRLAWTCLALVPSGLLVAVTAHVATDVASGPLLWIVPLALYLLSFVLSFSDKPLLPPAFFLRAQPVAMGLLAMLFLWASKINWSLALGGHLFAFFVTCMVCHQRLYARRPAEHALTGFYVYLSLGGVLGGCFSALLAPAIFPTILEYPLLALCGLLARPDIFSTARRTWISDGLFVATVAAGLGIATIATRQPVAVFVVSITVLAVLIAFLGRRPVLLVLLAGCTFAATAFFDPTHSTVYEGRSFYGAYKVADVDGGRFRVLFHGTTAHGTEMVRDASGHALSSPPDPLAYYYRGGPLSEALYAARERAGTLHNVALVGLGVGALTCYRRPHEQWTLYEIDPLMVFIARDSGLFRSMSSCARNAPIVLGDGRLTLRQAGAPLDLLILDIFSSDAVPTHLLTREAFALYKTKLAPHGIIAFNISNKNMELASVVAASAATNGMTVAVKRDRRELSTPTTMRFASEVAIVARSRADLDHLKLDAAWQILLPNRGQRIWTDDYSDVLDAIIRRMEQASDSPH